MPQDDSLLATLQASTIGARKARDKDRTLVLTTVMSDIKNHQIALQRPLGVALEAPGPGRELQHPMDGARRPPGGLVHALGRPARGRRQLDAQPLPLQHLENAANDRGLADPWQTGEQDVPSHPILFTC